MLVEGTPPPSSSSPSLVYQAHKLHHRMLHSFTWISIFQTTDGDFWIENLHKRLSFGSAIWQTLRKKNLNQTIPSFQGQSKCDISLVRHLKFVVCLCLTACMHSYETVFSVMSACDGYQWLWAVRWDLQDRALAGGGGTKEKLRGRWGYS